MKLLSPISHPSGPLTLLAAHRWPLVIFCLAFLWRTLYVIIQTNTGWISGQFYSGDSPLYDSLAQELIAGRGFLREGRPTAYVTPGYPLFLAFCYSFLGRNFLLIGIVQSLLGAFACVFAYRMGELAFNRAAGIAAGLICALLPEFVLFTSGQILTEPLYIFVINAALCLILGSLPTDRMEEWKSGRREAVIPPPLSHSPPLPLQPFFRGMATAFVSGLFIGMSALVRPIALGFGVCAAAFLWRKAGRTRCALYLMGTLIPISAWTLRNWMVLGSPVITSTEAGWVLYLYHNPSTSGAKGGYAPDPVPLKQAEGLSEPQKNSLYLRHAFSFAIKNPGTELGLAGRRLWNLLRPTYEGASWRNLLISIVTYVPLILLAGWTLWEARFRSAGTGLLVLFILYHLLFSLLLASELRFRMPLEPVLAVFAGYRIAELVERLIRGRVGRSRAHHVFSPPGPAGEVRGG